MRKANSCCTQVDVEVTSLTKAGRKVAKNPNEDPSSLAQHALIAKIDASRSAKVRDKDSA